MKTYVDYDYYKHKYKGHMPENDFDRLVTRASMEIQNNIFDRDITGYEYEVQMATCSVADILLKIDNLENKKTSITLDKNIKTESLGKYSRTFETPGTENVEKEISNQKAKIKEEIRRYLLSTGLLYRGG